MELLLIRFRIGIVRYELIYTAHQGTVPTKRYTKHQTFTLHGNSTKQGNINHSARQKAAKPIVKGFVTLVSKLTSKAVFILILI
jgi:hypothetical protein